MGRMHSKFQCTAVSSSFFLLPSSFPEIQVCFRCVHVQVQQAHKQVLLGRHHHYKTFMKKTLVSMKDIVHCCITSKEGRKEGRKEGSTSNALSIWLFKNAIVQSCAFLFTLLLSKGSSTGQPLVQAIQYSTGTIQYVNNSVKLFCAFRIFYIICK